MDNPFIAMIMLFAGNFDIRSWASCYGQTIAIATNTALFSILGTTYGGNGQTTFMLPDLRGRVPVGQGQGIGLSNYVLGQFSGTENTTLLISNMPQHTHVATVNSLTVSQSASTAAGTSNTPGPTLVPAVLPTIGSGPGATSIKGYAVKDNTTSLAPDAVSGTVTNAFTGNNIPFSIMQPYLALSYQICLYGVFPSRN